MSMNVMVLGAGITGVTTAWFLHRAGFRVSVIERRDEAAQETSFANGGQISVSHPESWVNPSAPLIALRWLRVARVFKVPISELVRETAFLLGKRK